MRCLFLLFCLFTSRIIFGQCNIVTIPGNYNYGNCGDIQILSSSGIEVGLYGNCGLIQIVSPLVDDNLSTGIQEVPVSELIIQPNPSLGLFLIKSSVEILTTELYTIYGQKIYYDHESYFEKGYDLSFLPSGIYYLKVQYLHKEHSNIIKQIIIQN